MNHREAIEYGKEFNEKMNELEWKRIECYTYKIESDLENILAERDC